MKHTDDLMQAFIRADVALEQLCCDLLVELVRQESSNEEFHHDTQKLQDGAKALALMLQGFCEMMIHEDLSQARLAWNEKTQYLERRKAIRPLCRDDSNSDDSCSDNNKAPL